MRAEITKLHHRLDATFIYVTHDQVEAMTMADRIVVMKDGHIQQVDTPQALYDRPVNMFVAGFIGAPPMNFLPVTVTRRAGRFEAAFHGRDLPLPSRFQEILSDADVGRECVLGLRPENLHVRPPVDVDPALTAPLPMDVDLAEPMGAEVHLNGMLDDLPIVARVPPRCSAKAGDRLTLFADLSTAHLFDRQTEKAIGIGEGA